MPKLTNGAQTAWKHRAKKADGLLAGLYKAEWEDDEIAHAIGVSFNTIRRWRLGKATPQGPHVKALASLATGVQGGKIKRPRRLVA